MKTNYVPMPMEHDKKIALVAHEHRTRLREWAMRRAFYGSSAAPLSVRHADKTAPLIIPLWSLLTWLLLALASWPGLLGALISAGVYSRRVDRSVRAGDEEEPVVLGSKGGEEGIKP